LHQAEKGTSHEEEKCTRSRVLGLAPWRWLEQLNLAKRFNCYGTKKERHMKKKNAPVRGFWDWLLGGGWN
jgi:hypothetical protein